MIVPTFAFFIRLGNFFYAALFVKSIFSDSFHFADKYKAKTGAPEKLLVNWIDPYRFCKIIPLKF